MNLAGVKRPLRSLIFQILLVAFCTGFTLAQQSPRDFIKENYTKRELMVPMRDGVKLFTAVYEPKDRSEKYPILLTRTPFSCAPYGADALPGSLGPSGLFAREKYIFVYQDVRGLWASEGVFEHLRPERAAGSKQTDESTDAYDTVDWLVKNVAGNSGRVGIYGVSYPGFFTSAGIINTHPAIKAASPQAPVADSFMGDDLRHNGAPFLAQNYVFYTIYDDRSKLKPNDFSVFEPFQWPSENGYDIFLKMGGLKEAGDNYQKLMNRRSAFWDEAAKHPNYDQFWKDRNILTHLRNINTPVLVTGGWFDNEDLYGTLATYRQIRKINRANPTYLVVGPWSHNSWSRVDGDWLGTAYFGSKTAVDYREELELPFFNYYLKGKGDVAKLKPVNVFDTGSNVWRRFEDYDPSAATATPLYLAGGSKLSFKPAGAAGSDEYVSDPANPVPYTQKIAVDYPRDFMTEDQRFASARRDVLTYQTDVLAEDITVAGDIRPEIFFASGGTDSDVIVKLIDVFPDDYKYPDGATPPADSAAPGFKPGGYQMLLRGEPVPLRFRNGFERPEPAKPNAAMRVAYVMPGVAHTFKKGHRIMVQIQSTWFPLVARNPQSFIADFFNASEKDFRRVTQRVLYGGAKGSKIVLPIVRMQR